MFSSTSASPPASERNHAMQDMLWLGVLAGLFLLTLAFVRLCDHA